MCGKLILLVCIFECKKENNIANNNKMNTKIKRVYYTLKSISAKRLVTAFSTTSNKCVSLHNQCISTVFFYLQPLYPVQGFWIVKKSAVCSQN